MVFFAGGTRHQDLEYSGLARQTLHNLTQEWKDPDYEVRAGHGAGMGGGAAQRHDKLSMTAPPLPFPLSPFPPAHPIHAWQFVEGGVPDYEDRLRTSKFCLAAYGCGGAGLGAMRFMLAAASSPRPQLLLRSLVEWPLPPCMVSARRCRHGWGELFCGGGGSWR